MQQTEKRKKWETSEGLASNACFRSSFSQTPHFPTSTPSYTFSSSHRPFLIPPLFGFLYNKRVVFFFKFYFIFFASSSEEEKRLCLNEGVGRVLILETGNFLWISFVYRLRPRHSRGEPHGSRLPMLVLATLTRPQQHRRSHICRPTHPLLCSRCYFSSARGRMMRVTPPRAWTKERELVLARFFAFVSFLSAPDTVALRFQPSLCNQIASGFPFYIRICHCVRLPSQYSDECKTILNIVCTFPDLFQRRITTRCQRLMFLS